MRSPTVVDNDSQEDLGVFAHRYRQAIHAGLQPDDALTFAGSDADVGVLRKLVEGGATPEQIIAIAL